MYTLLRTAVGGHIYHTTQPDAAGHVPTPCDCVCVLMDGYGCGHYRLACHTECTDNKGCLSCVRSVLVGQPNERNVIWSVSLVLVPGNPRTLTQELIPSIQCDDSTEPCRTAKT